MNDTTIRLIHACSWSTDREWTPHSIWNLELFSGTQRCKWGCISLLTCSARNSICWRGSVFNTAGSLPFMIRRAHVQEKSVRRISYLTPKTLKGGGNKLRCSGSEAAPMLFREPKRHLTTHFPRGRFVSLGATAVKRYHQKPKNAEERRNPNGASSETGNRMGDGERKAHEATLRLRTWWILCQTRKINDIHSLPRGSTYIQKYTHSGVNEGGFSLQLEEARARRKVHCTPWLIPL